MLETATRLRRATEVSCGLVILCGLVFVQALGCTREDSQAGEELSVGVHSADSDSQLSAANEQAELAATEPLQAAAGAIEQSLQRRGFVVWESNRSGHWRLWLRALDGGEARQLSPDEAGRAHCCPHIAPDGRSIAYLSLPRGQERYPTQGASGPLWLIAPEGSPPQQLVSEARTYFEHRAVVWRSPRELLFIDGQGRSQLLDLEPGPNATRASVGENLTNTALGEHGWLFDAQLRFATTGSPTFSPYDAQSRSVDELPTLGGCQPYFSHDGRWGFWIAGAGGPVKRFDLLSRQASTVLAKSDPRLPTDRGYLYFPMLARDGRWLAVAASPDDHDHQKADYDVFVFPTDPEGLQIRGEALRITQHPATDRFPDVFGPQLELGSQAGEAPFTVQLSLPTSATEAPANAATEWTWDLGDGTRASGMGPTHRYSQPGTYAVRAWQGAELPRPDNIGTEAGQMLHGQVRVTKARPPTLQEHSLHGGGTILRLTFDEAVDLEGARFALASGTAISATLGKQERQVELELQRPLAGADTLRLSGLRDRAQQPNSIAAMELALLPPAWPSNRQGLVFLWQSGQELNRVDDLDGVAGGTTVLQAKGRVWLDRHHSMVLAGGHYLADHATMERLLAGLRRRNELSLELTVNPQTESGYLFSFSSGRSSRNLSLLLQNGRLMLRLRTPYTGRNADQPVIDLGPLPMDRSTHLVLSYTPGKLVLYRDGQKAVEETRLQGGFFHWQPLPLLLGDEWGGGHAWRGSMEGIAVYDRFLAAEEVAENARLWQELRAQRGAAPELLANATLVARSQIPDLEQIAPYRDALAVYEYRLDSVHSSSGTWNAKLEPGQEIRVVHRVLSDGERLAPVRRKVGQSTELRLQPFSDQPQLESLYLSETLPLRLDLTLLYSLDPLG